MRYTIAVLSMAILGGSLLSACDSSGVESANAESATSQRQQDMQQILRGGRIYQQNCAVCHGKLAQGADNWRQRVDGKFPPPPLDGTGHTWHHPHRQLVEVIKNGTAALGGNMPAWEGKLTDEEIEAVLAWIRAQWPDEIHAEWQKINRRAERN